MNSNKIPIREVVTIVIGEIIVGAVICAVFLLCGKYDYKVLLGAALGGAVTVGNFLFLCITVNRALDKCLANFTPTLTEKNAEPIIIQNTNSEDSDEKDENTNSEEEPCDDEAAKFAKENAGKLRNAIKLSYIIRMMTVIIAMGVALMTKQFNLIATVIPLLCLRPILSAAEIFRRKEKSNL